MVTHTFNSSIQEAEVGGSEFEAGLIYGVSLDSEEYTQKSCL